MTPSESAARRVIIVAGNKVQAEDYRRRKGLSPRECIYATGQSLRGLAGDFMVARVGTWRDRRDLAAIGADLAIIGMRGRLTDE